MIGKELQERMKAGSWIALAKHLWVEYATISKRYINGKIPRRHRRKLVEFFEWYADDNMDFCDKLLKNDKNVK
jgi:hypothetical protein